MVEGFHHRKMRAQPAAIQPSPAPGDAEHRRRQQQRRRDRAEQNIERHLAVVDPAGQLLVQPQRPRVAEDDQVAGDQVEAQQVEHRREHEHMCIRDRIRAVR